MALVTVLMFFTVMPPRVSASSISHISFIKACSGLVGKFWIKPNKFMIWENFFHLKLTSSYASIWPDPVVYMDEINPLESAFVCFGRFQTPFAKLLSLSGYCFSYSYLSSSSASETLSKAMENSLLNFCKANFRFFSWYELGGFVALIFSWSSLSIDLSLWSFSAYRRNASAYKSACLLLGDSLPDLLAGLLLFELLLLFMFSFRSLTWLPFKFLALLARDKKTGACLRWASTIVFCTYSCFLILSLCS